MPEGQASRPDAPCADRCTDDGTARHLPWLYLTCQAGIAGSAG